MLHNLFGIFLIPLFVNFSPNSASVPRIILASGLKKNVDDLGKSLNLYFHTQPDLSFWQLNHFKMIFIIPYN